MKFIYGDRLESNNGKTVDDPWEKREEQKEKGKSTGRSSKENKSEELQEIEELGEPSKEQGKNSSPTDSEDQNPTLCVKCEEMGEKRPASQKVSIDGEEKPLCDICLQEMGLQMSS